jgi:hypothetical protein
MDVEREERRCEIRFGGDVDRGLSISDALDAEEEFGTTTTGCVAIDLGQRFSCGSSFSFERPWAKATSEAQCVEPGLATWACHHVAQETEEACYQLSIHPVAWSSGSTITNSSCNRIPLVTRELRNTRARSLCLKKRLGHSRLLDVGPRAGLDLFLLRFITAKVCRLFSLAFEGKEKVRNILPGEEVQTYPQRRVETSA